MSQLTPQAILCRRVFRDRASEGLTLLLAAAQFMGLQDLTSFDEETIIEELGDDLQIQEFNISTMSRFMAARTILISDAFFNDWQIFSQLCNSLDGDAPSADFEPPELEEIGWAVTQAGFIHPTAERENLEFSEDVRRYIGLQLREEGYLKPPGILSVAIMPKDAAVDTVGLNPEVVLATNTLQDERIAEFDKEMRNRINVLIKQLEVFPQLGLKNAPDPAKQLLQVMRS